jgi:uncharacterized protein (DUF2147 family)
MKTRIVGSLIRSARTAALAGMLAMLSLGQCGEAPAAPRNPDDVLGEWEIEEGGSIVALRRCGENNERFCGQLSWMEHNTYTGDDPNAGELKIDRENPDPELRDTPLLGIDLVHGFRWDPEQNRWVDGKIYNPFDGETYSCWLEMESEKKLKIRGYIGLPILGMTTYWARPESNPATRGGFTAGPLRAAR